MMSSLQRPRRFKIVWLLLFLFTVAISSSYFWAFHTLQKYSALTGQRSSWESPLNSSPTSSQPLASLLRHNRSFTFDPVTAEESEILMERDKSGIKAAVCHRTLFGNISMDPLFAFVSYYRLLGFDHIYFWYRPNIPQLARFDELRSLPYITMKEYRLGGAGSEYGQGAVEKECLAKSTAEYNWTLVIDVDEYLWFNSYMSVKEFLSIYNANYTFLSFGKWMYTMNHQVEGREIGSFGFDSCAFTAKSYCNVFRRSPQTNFSYCPSHQGRSKVMAKPAVHKFVNVHGIGFNPTYPPLKHFDTSIAHLKEWPDLLRERGSRTNIHHRPPVDFNVSSNLEVHMHDVMNTHKLAADGSVVTMYYDAELRDWMRFVASGCTKQ